jgi:preprotein translocase subunit SecE
VAKETRRQRRDARRAEGSQPAASPPPPPAGDLAVAGGVASERRRGGFIRESVAELLKVDWPNRAQVIQGTIVVIVACAVIGAYLWGIDQIFRPFVRDVLLGQ